MTGKIPLRAKLLILTAVLASLLEIIDTSVVNVAVPTMMGNLGCTLDEISWVITGYIIANAIVLPIAGWMSEQIGRKLYYTACIVTFTAASIACGLAPNLTVLVIFRIIQGLAGGALLPTSQALIYEAFPKEQAGMASAIYGMSVMVGPTLGPTLGGYLTDNFGWRSIFNVNLPIGVVVAFLSFLLVEDVGFDPVAAAKAKAGGAPIEKVRRQRIPVDGIGLALLVSGIGCMQYVLERWHADDWFSSRAILLCLVVAVVSLVSLIAWESRTEHPILQLRHFKVNSFRYGVILMTALGAMLYGLIFLIPVFVSRIQGLTATQTGELFIPGALFGAMLMPMIGNQLRKRDARQLILLGFVTLGTAIFMISRFDSDTSADGMFWALLVRGGAMALLFVPINTVVLVDFSGAEIGQAAGMLNLCRQLGGSVAIAMMSTLMQTYSDQSYAVLSSHVSWFDPAAVYTHNAIMGGMKAKMAGLIGMGTPATQVAKLLYFRAKQQSFIIAYQKTLALAAAISVVTLIPVGLMKKSKIGGGPVSAH